MYQWNSFTTWAWFFSSVFSWHCIYWRKSTVKNWIFEIYLIEMLPDRVVGLQSKPLWHRPVLVLLLSQNFLNSKCLVRTLEIWKIKNQQLKCLDFQSKFWHDKTKVAFVNKLTLQKRIEQTQKRREPIISHIWFHMSWRDYWLIRQLIDNSALQFGNTKQVKDTYHFCFRLCFFSNNTNINLVYVCVCVCS